MLSMLRKATESLKKGGISNLVEQYDGVEDLSAWEIVNASLSDDEDRYSFDGDGPEAKLIEEEEGDEDARESRELGPPNDVVFTQSLSVSPPMIFHADFTPYNLYDDEDDDGGGVYDNLYHDEDDDDDDDDVMYDDDDDLVKWKVKRLGKGRMKMGEMGVRKVKNSKKLPYYYYNRP